MTIVGGLDIHRKQITFDYVDTVTGQVRRGRIMPADREHLAGWLAQRFPGRTDVEFALEGCTGWRYVAEELATAGMVAHVAEPADTAALRGGRRHAKTDKTDSRHLRELLAAERLPQCWIPPAQVLECRALLELYRDLRVEHTAWVQRIHAVLFHQGAGALTESALRSQAGLVELSEQAADLSPDAFERDVAAIVARPEVTVIHFWAPWCPNCRAEMTPDGWAKFIGDNPKVQVVFVNLWHRNEDPAPKLAAARLGLQPNLRLLTHPNPSRLEADRVNRFLGLPITWIPSTWIYRDGQLRVAFNYGEIRFPVLQQMVDDATKTW